MYEFPFVSENNSRYSILKEFDALSQDKIINDLDSIKIGYKKYELGSKNKSNNILEKCSLILNKNYNYDIDGLILLPMNLAVGSDKPDTIQKDISKTWNKNFKWKPEKENTIDFLIKTKKKNGKDIIMPYNDGDTINYYKTVELYVKYNFYLDDSINYSLKILDNSKYYKNEKSKIILFNPEENKVLHTTNIPIKDGKMICEKDGKEINDNSIVEMRYNFNNSDGFLWTPTRLRSDKSNPNSFITANDNWKTIINPINQNMITGKEEFTYIPSEKDMDLYYKDKSLYYKSEPLKYFHNYIKSKLIIGVCNTFKNVKLLDTSIGRGGDINKYTNKDSNIKLIMGIDISSNVNEAAKRFYQVKEKKPIGIFIRGDTSKRISNADCAQNLPNKDKIHSESIINIMYNNKSKIPPTYNNIKNKDSRFRG